MASGDGDGFMWLCLIGLAVWVYSDSSKVKAERIERIDSVVDVDQKVSTLETRIIALERDIKFAQGDLERAAAKQDTIVKTFNHNVAIENKEAVKRMTARGACGQETFYPEGGGVVMRNKQCTLKDLEPAGRP